MNFGQAIEALKMGKKVRRQEWKGNVMFLWLKPAGIIKAEWCKDPMLKVIVEEHGGEIPATGTICMLTPQNGVMSGWTPSQDDMLSEDWEEVVGCFLTRHE